MDGNALRYTLIGETSNGAQWVSAAGSGACSEDAAKAARYGNNGASVAGGEEQHKGRGMAAGWGLAGVG